MSKSESSLARAIGDFMRSTTLHGFKYLRSEYYIDRIGWVICCCASACCAGVLCAVLWARFLQVPALLQLRDLGAEDSAIAHMPLVAVCSPAGAFATAFLSQPHLANSSNLKRLPTTVTRLLEGRTTAEDQLQILEKLLIAQNTSLTEVMFKYSPPCEELAVMCRWLAAAVPCQLIFEKELTSRGICCIMRPERSYYSLNETMRPSARLDATRTLDLTLQCSADSTHGCRFFTKFDGEENPEPVALAPGSVYLAQLRFISVPQSAAEEVVESECIADKEYSKATCMDKCAERYCACADPLRDRAIDEENNLPPCTVTQLGCLRAHDNQENTTCNCSPSCSKVTTFTSLESSPLDFNVYTVDPIYSGVNATTSTVVLIRVNIALSRIFHLNPTETWLTLLSSLGGVFNMFLGVGLFSALEILFLLFVKFPMALRKSSEMNNSIVVNLN